jgi:lipopolysaccharide biosynthesis glycosyltransferase
MPRTEAQDSSAGEVGGLKWKGKLGRPMIIVCNINNEYIRHCAVMLRSLRDFNPRDDLDVFIVHQRVDGDQRAMLVRYLSSFLPSVSFLQVDHALLKGFPESAHVKLAAYYRLFFPQILPSSIDRIIYLDSDLLVNGSLDELWETPLESHLVAAASDRNLDMQRSRLGLGPDSPYFNSGVMTLKLSDWRQENIAERGLEFALKYPEKLTNCDQDVLNYLLAKRSLILHQRWNAMSHLWGLDQQWLQAQGGLSEEEKQAQSDPVIIHFAGAGFAKPWHYQCPHPWKDRYRSILATTPWAGTPLEGEPVRRSLLQRSATKISSLLNQGAKN